MGLLCAAYVVPGVVGRDPWKFADLTAFGYAMELAQGSSFWTQPSLGGLHSDLALLPYWLGAAFIRLAPAWADPAFMARLPYALMLAATLALVWGTCFFLARTDKAQPLAFAFGGQAKPLDYARSLADASVLAFMASLGLLQLGHETTPELVQLFGVTGWMFGLALAPFRPWVSRLFVMLTLALLALSGGPSIALCLGATGLLILGGSRMPMARSLWPWVVVSMLCSLGMATALHGWIYRLGFPASWEACESILKAFVWFAWPVWPLAAWTLWQWRSMLTHRHIAIPASTALLFMLAFIGMNGSDRTLMLAIPGLAMLAAFALPTLRRGAASAIDWFSLLCTGLCALVIWVVYAAMHTGHPWQTATNVQRLLPGFEAPFSFMALAWALAGSLAWLALVYWRAQRSDLPIWKSLVLPASGVALGWLLLNTLWLPALNYARSYTPVVQQVQQWVPLGSAIYAPGISPALLSALRYQGGYPVQAQTLDKPHQTYSHALIRIKLKPGVPAHEQGLSLPAPPHPDYEAWSVLGHPADKEERIILYRLKPQSLNHPNP